jgi:N-acetylneuraminic acid mutarotase
MIFNMLNFFPVVLGLVAGMPGAVYADHAHDHEFEKITWTAIADLPSARSDMTATVSSATGTDLIYIVGGCDADQGKSPYGDWYACPSITDTCDIYNPVTNTYSSCTAAPNTRYRHAAVNVAGEIWLVGGVDGNDAAVKTVDVYDPNTDTWRSHGEWSDATSDLAAFAVGTDIYMVGGYDVTDFAFTAQSAVWKMSTTEVVASATTPVTVTQVASMTSPRGDIFAAVSEDHVYVTGGFSHEDYWCSPHASVERWILADNTWEDVPAMTYERGDKALMHMNGQIYAIGGETKANCDLVNASTPVEHVEIFNEATNEWTDATVIPEETFRFVAVAHEASDSIYIFGGQNYYDPDCDCYPVSKDALQFVDQDWSVDTLGGGGASFGVGLLVGLVAFFGGVFNTL